jgi:ATP-dependent Lon protease
MNHYDIKDVKERILDSWRSSNCGGRQEPDSLFYAVLREWARLRWAFDRARDGPQIRAAESGWGDEAELRGHRRTYVGAMPTASFNQFAGRR